MAANPDIEHFARLIDTLNPWLDQVVIIGGWAHRLYRLHPLAQPLDYEPLGTLDTDVAVPAQLPATGEEIRQRLLDNGFREELMGKMQPPAAHYHVATDDSGFYAEFLTPLIGGAIKRGGKRDATAQIAGVSAQKLRHLELLLDAPWEVMIAPANGYPTARAQQVHVPSAAAFLAQKILIHDKRDRADKAKDILYIHDTIETFGGNLPAIREGWETNVKPALQARASREVEGAAETHFQDVDDTIREAARIATGRNLTAEMVREVCSYGWKQVFS
jgi:nucleotidyltransferase-like protein